MRKRTLKRILASRANGAKSRGPNTPEGKARSAANSLWHGLCAKSLLLPGESHDRFQELLQGFEADISPQSAIARFQVEQLAAAAWRLRRAQAFETTLVRDQLAKEAATEDDKPDAQTAVTRAWANSRNDLVTRYESTQNRAFRQFLRPPPHQPPRKRGSPGRPTNSIKSGRYPAKTIFAERTRDGCVYFGTTDQRSGG